MCVELKVTKETPRSILNLLDLIFCVTSFLTWSFNFLPQTSLSLPLSVPLPPFLSLSLSLSVAFGTWSRRVRFKNSDPILDSSLVIMSTEVSDEGKYTCHIITFPSGNFDREMSLIVWSESLPHGSAIQ